MSDNCEWIIITNMTCLPFTLHYGALSRGLKCGRVHCRCSRGEFVSVTDESRLFALNRSLNGPLGNVETFAAISLFNLQL